MGLAAAARKTADGTDAAVESSDVCALNGAVIVSHVAAPSRWHVRRATLYVLERKESKTERPLPIDHGRGRRSRRCARFTPAYLPSTKAPDRSGRGRC